MPEECVAVVKNPEAVPSRGRLLLPFDPGTFELDDPSAEDADHMVVVAVPERVLVEDAVLAEPALLDESGLDHEGERPVGRDAAHPRAPLAGQFGEVVRREMRVRGEDRLGELDPLPRHGQAPGDQRRPEGVHFAVDVHSVA